MARPRSPGSPVREGPAPEGRDHWHLSGCASSPRGEEPLEPPDPSDQSGWVTVGEIHGLFGVQGRVRLFSFLKHPPALLEFEHLWLVLEGQRRAFRVLESKCQGPRLIACLETISDRERARQLLGTRIQVPRASLDEGEEGEYLWADLLGQRVQTDAGRPLGKVTHLLDTGANDVLVVQDAGRERLIPFLADTILEVDLEGGMIRVDWDPDF